MSGMPHPQHIRVDYGKHALDESHVLSDPIAQFARWFDDAVNAKCAEPNAMIVATASASGLPSARVMLLKGFDEQGFVFFTNYTSRKAADIEKNPHASLVFFWHDLERQVRIEGSIEKVSRQESEVYFYSRPRESQIGAWTSHQSREIKTRHDLEKRQKELLARFGDGTIPFPDFWGGYRVTPNRIEFWQGRPSRLHDRLAYHKERDGSWTISRLEP
jgi:pyridoxamine 5'-phosphate oxidase